jgi:hypothetical protein
LTTNPLSRVARELDALTMPRFVVLRHELPAGGERASHWDVMFECAGTLRTWAVESEPGAAEPSAARRLGDHRLAYLDYEGPVSGERGTVSRWDAGEYTLVVHEPERWEADLRGARLVGRMTLVRVVDSHSWRVSFSAAPTSG